MAKITTIFIASSLIFPVFQKSVITQANEQPAATSSTKGKTGVTAIQSYCQDLDFYVASHLTSARAFVKETAGRDWRESPKPFSDDGHKKYIFKTLVWVRDGKPLVVSLDQLRKNRKSSDNLKMYFRSDGTIAKSVLVVDEISKQGNHIVKGKIQYFDARGKVLRTIIGTKDMKTKKLSKGGDFSHIRMPFYFKFTALPFYHLIKKPIVKRKE